MLVHVGSEVVVKITRLPCLQAEIDTEQSWQNKRRRKEFMFVAARKEDVSQN